MKNLVECIDKEKTLIFRGVFFHLPDIKDKEWSLMKALADYINTQSEDLEEAKQKINDIKTALYD